VDFTGFLDVYAHSCASLGCTAVAIGLPYRMQDGLFGIVRISTGKPAPGSARRVMASITLAVSPDPK